MPPPAAVEAGHPTTVLRAAGILAGGRVVSAQVVHAFPTVLSQLHRLKLDDEGDTAKAPRHLYLKTDLPGGPGVALEGGRQEVTFYRQALRG
jgi:hypothetical protein